MKNTNDLDMNAPLRGPRTASWKRNGKTVRTHHAWAVRAVSRARTETRNFWNMKMSPDVATKLIEAALLDEFSPKLKLRARREGDHFSNALTAVMMEMKGVANT